MLLHNFRNFSVLIVDDEPLMRNLVRGVLVSLGFTNVTEAKSGRIAIDLLSRNNFDFVITDWRMDDLEGIDIVKYVRGTKTPPFCSTPIIMLTGNTEAHYVREAISAGVSSYLIKPFSAELLAKRIRDLIENTRHFIISENYTGPDRRHVNLPPPGGIERRRNKAAEDNRTKK